MPEETQEQVVEESQVEEAQVEETETPETTEETVEPDPLAEKWQKVAPDIADAVGNLTPEERVGILLNRLAAQPAGAPPEGSDATAATPDGQKPQTPLAAEIPNLDPDALVAGFQEAVETNNGEQAGKLMGQALEWMRALGGVMSGAINENQDEMGKMRGLLMLPSPQSFATPYLMSGARRRRTFPQREPNSPAGRLEPSKRP